jgi:hypothetical protein
MNGKNARNRLEEMSELISGSLDSSSEGNVSMYIFGFLR